MFVPRALRLKGVKEPKKDDVEPPAKKRRIASLIPNSQTEDKATTSAEATEKRSVEPSAGSTTSNAEYLGFLTAGIELIFTDYAMQSKEGDAWLRKHYRNLDRTPGAVPCERGKRPDSIGDGMYVHLSAILEHTNISTLKPAATQPILQRALREHPSPYLELSEDGYFVRRKPSTYPIKSIPADAFECVDYNGVPFWDERTVYVEPHIRNLCQTPARVAYWLKEHGNIRERWLPIQAVTSIYNSCAFVTLSGNVTVEDMWAKWRAGGKPEWWKIMTKMEHTKRTNEYVELLKKEKAERENVKRRGHKALPEKTVAEALEEALPEPAKKKKKRGKGRKKTVMEDEEATGGGTAGPSNTNDEAAAHDNIPETANHGVPSQSDCLTGDGGHVRFDD